MDITYTTLTVVGLLVSIGVSLFSLSRSGRKDQLDLDKAQDTSISNLQSDVRVLITEQAGLKERVAKVEGRQDLFDNRLSTELKSMEEKIEKRISTMETNLTSLITSLKP